MRYLKVLVLIFATAILFSNRASAQPTAFTFQGSLQNSAMPANGNYDFEFALYSVLAGGVQFGPTVAVNNVVVTNGIFTARLDFGSQFSGGTRYLEIRVRPAGQPGITTLAPRQLINSVPYSIRSLSADNADAVGGQSGASIAAAVLAVNSATQANVPNTLVMRSANGDFAAGTIFATQQYNINANRVLGINGSNNIFVGVNAGVSNTSGDSNAFVGSGAGQSNTTGANNSFFGRRAGLLNSSGSDNSFFGTNSGDSNTQGLSNSFFGRSAGESNTEGSNNSFFGRSAGESNTLGAGNSFFGGNAGSANTTGGNNSFFGIESGAVNTEGNDNSYFGYRAGYLNSQGSGNSFFGASAGRVNFGGFNTFIGVDAGLDNITGSANTLIGYGADVDNGNLLFATALGAGAIVSTSNTVVLGRTDDTVRIPGFLRVVRLGIPGTVPLCQNNVNLTISTCSSSIRYKSNVTPFRPGLGLIKRLRPVSFNWNEGGMLDMGLVAEEVAAIEPLLTTTNSKGELEGVKYDRVGVVLVNAVKEQQSQIEGQEATIEAQRRSIDELKQQVEALKRLVCATNPTAEVCKEN